MAFTTRPFGTVHSDAAIFLSVTICLESDGLCFARTEIANHRGMCKNMPCAQNAILNVHGVDETCGEYAIELCSTCDAAPYAYGWAPNMARTSPPSRTHPAVPLQTRDSIGRRVPRACAASTERALTGYWYTLVFVCLSVPGLRPPNVCAKT